MPLVFRLVTARIAMLVILLCRSGVFVDVMVTPCLRSPRRRQRSVLVLDLGPRFRAHRRSPPSLAIDRCFVAGLAGARLQRGAECHVGRRLHDNHVSLGDFSTTRQLTLRRWLDKEKMERNGTTRWMVLIHWMILIHWTTTRLVEEKLYNCRGPLP